jgi:hypothetical protein
MKGIRVAIIVWVVVHIAAPVLLAQKPQGVLLPATIVGKDTLPIVALDEIVVLSKRHFQSAEDYARFSQLQYNVRMVYPYAKLASKIFNDIQDSLSYMDSKHERKKFLKRKEKDLDEQFEKPLKNLTIDQGKILVKLIARETGHSCYELVEQFKSPFSAFYWNGLGKIFGYNLKPDYDPEQDRDLEIIVRSLEGDAMNVQ